LQACPRRCWGHGDSNNVGLTDQGLRHAG
jgi:hypothetical protein